MKITDYIRLTINSLCLMFLVYILTNGLHDGTRIQWAGYLMGIATPVYVFELFRAMRILLGGSSIKTDIDYIVALNRQEALQTLAMYGGVTDGENIELEALTENILVWEQRFGLGQYAPRDCGDIVINCPLSDTNYTPETFEALRKLPGKVPDKACPGDDDL